MQSNQYVATNAWEFSADHVRMSSTDACPLPVPVAPPGYTPEVLFCLPHIMSENLVTGSYNADFEVRCPFVPVSDASQRRSRVSARS